MERVVPSRTHAVTVLLAVAVALAMVPAPALAAERTGGTVVVEADETVDDDLRAIGGTVIVRGTVTGDLTVVAGSLVIDGTVEGNVEGTAGSIRVDGSVGGNFDVSAGSVRVAGPIGGDATVGTGSLTFADDGRVDGDLTYDAESTDGLTEDRVGGTTTEDEGLRQAVPDASIPWWAGALYFFLANLLLGAILLLVLPRFTGAVANRGTGSPLLSLGVGLLALLAIPIALALIALTVVGIPLTVFGFILYALLLWAGAIYGAYVLGAWVLSLAGVDSRWLALFVGLVAVALVGWVPVVGGLVQFVVLLFGLGALSLVLVGGWRARRGPERGTAITDDGRDDRPAITD